MSSERTTTDQAPPAGDPRFTHGLISDVFAVLEAHGYARPDGNPSATGLAMLALGDLVAAFEGRS